MSQPEPGAMIDAQFEPRGAFKLKHGANQPANRWYQQGVRAMVAWVQLCRPYGGRQCGILVHPVEQGLLTTDDQPRATTARLRVKQNDRGQLRGHAHEMDLRVGTAGHQHRQGDT